MYLKKGGKYPAKKLCMCPFGPMLRDQCPPQCNAASVFPKQMFIA